MSTFAPSPLPYFGRAWQVKVTTASGPLTISNAVTESLRITFDCQLYMTLQYWLGTISVYNLSQSTANQIIGDPNNPLQFNQILQQGATVELSAGYQNTGVGAFNPNANIIYKGHLLQPIWTRENVIDWKLTLRCALGFVEDAYGAVNFSLAAGSTAYQALQQVCAQAHLPLTVDTPSQKILSSSQFGRGQTFFGRPFDQIAKILKQFTGQIYTWYSPAGLNILSADPKNNPLPTPAYAYGPPNVKSTVNPSDTTQGLVKQTLIGTPQQNQNGVTFQVLLDSAPKIGDVVQIAPGVLITPFQFQLGSKDLQPIPSRNGRYRIAGLRYVGDTRGHGSDWFTEIIGVSNAFQFGFLNSSDPNR